MSERPETPLEQRTLELWTSNSWRRFRFREGDPACEPITQPSDGHPDLYFPGGFEGPVARRFLATWDACKGIHTDALPQLRAALQDTQHLIKDRDDLAKLVYVPGVMRCAKCGLRLVTTAIHADSGRMAADNSPQDCPNGCGPLWRVTERDAGNDLCDQLALKQAELDEALAALREFQSAQAYGERYAGLNSAEAQEHKAEAWESAFAACKTVLDKHPERPAATVPPYTLSIRYDGWEDVLTIEKTKYHGQLFRGLASIVPVGKWIRVQERRPDGALVIETERK